MGRNAMSRSGIAHQRKTILKEIGKLHKKGESLQPKDIGSLYQAATKYFRDGYKEALKKAGLSYEVLGIKDCSRKWSKKTILKKLKKMDQAKESLNATYMQKNYTALFAACKHYFGSYENAVTDAGIDYKKFRRGWNMKKWIDGLSDKDMAELQKKIEKLC